MAKDERIKDTLEYKEKKKIRNKKYREKNKEKQKEYLKRNHI